MSSTITESPCFACELTISLVEPNVGLGSKATTSLGTDVSRL